MLIGTFEIVPLCRFVGFSGKTSQAIMKQIYPQRINASYQNIDSEIEFVAVNEQRVVDVSLDYTVVADQYIYIFNNIPSNLLAK